MRLFRILGVAAVISLLAHVVSAQDRPFVFSVTTAPQVSKPQVLVDYAVGVGEGAFRATTAAGPEQRFGIQASLGRWTLVGRVGLASVSGAYRTSQQGEILLSLLTEQTSGMSLAVGGGMLREAGGVNVALARVVAGRDYGNWRLHGNLLFQKPLATTRDEVDLITTVGWARRVTDAVSLGVEGIGEDLEGFWDPLEAEGGARLLVGPSLHIAPRGKSWQLSVAGGPMFHPSNTGRSSTALRDLPAMTRERGYALRTSLSVNF